MERENMRIATALFLVLAFSSISFAITPCSSCFSTFIGITEKDGTIEATVFLVNESTRLEQNISFFDAEVKKFLTGAEGTPNITNVTVVTVDVNATPIKDAEIFFYTYDRLGNKVNLTDSGGASACNPAVASNLWTYSYIDNTTGQSIPTTVSKYYATCTVPIGLYANSAVTVYLEYKGNQTTKPSEREVTVYDTSAGGLNVIAALLQDTTVIDPTRPVCLMGMIMFGLLLASMYYSGKSPLSYLDISVPRITKPKPFGFGPLVAGAGNVRLGMPAMWGVKWLDVLINRHSKVDFRGMGLRADIENAIEKSSANPVQKYFARAEALRGGDWRSVLSADDKKLVRDAERGRWEIKGRGVSHQLLMAMNQRIAARKTVEGMAVVGGGQPKWLVKYWTYQIRKVPLIGTFLSIATGSTFYAFRTGRFMAESLFSPAVRKAMGQKYRDFTAAEQARAPPVRTVMEPGEAPPAPKPAPKKEGMGRITKYLYGVASMTDQSKMVLGKLFPLHEYAERFYKDARDAMYDEVTRNILWLELYEQLSKEIGAQRAKELIRSQMNFRKVFTDPEFINALGRVKLPEEYLRILRNPEYSSEMKAHLMVDAAQHLRVHAKYSSFWSEAIRMEQQLDMIERLPSDRYSPYEKAERLVKFVRSVHHVDQPYNLAHDITEGKFFITTGRNNLYYEENGVKKNFGFFALGMKEMLDQMAYAGTKKKGLLAEEQQFTLQDAFKLAWLKLTSQMFGHDNWYLDEGGQDLSLTNPFTDKRKGYRFQNDVTVTDPVTGKPKQVSMVRDVLGLNVGDVTQIHARMNDYFGSFLTNVGKKALGLPHEGMTPEEIKELKRARSESAKSIGVGPDDLGYKHFLYSFGLQKTRLAEETAKLPWNRRQWYVMTSESYPEEENWRANMNFIWSEGAVGVDKRITALYVTRGLKYWSSMPQTEEAWTMMENFMDSRLANIMNGSQPDFFGYDQEKRDALKRLSRVDMQKHFNETWDFYSKAREGLAAFYRERTGNKPATNSDLFDFLGRPENQKITYEMLRKGKTAFIYTHDFSYLPYAKGMPVSDFDRIVNGVFVIEDGKGKRTFDFNKLGKYNTELTKAEENKELNDLLSSAGMLKAAPTPENLARFKAAVAGAKVPGLSGARLGAIAAELEEIARLSYGSSDISAYVKRLGHAIGEVVEIRKSIQKSSMGMDEKYALLRALDGVDPNMLSMRQLTHEELNSVKDALRRSGASSEVKLAFMYQFSRATHDWQSLWADSDFIRLVPENEIREENRHRGAMGRFIVRALGASTVDAIYDKLRGAAGMFEAAVYGAGKVEAQAMANNVAITELYRERGHDMMVRMKSGGFLDKLELTASDRKTLERDYMNYADSFQRYFIGWMDSVTRDPRGSSTQWGRQWYLATMYHRGGAMHPESHEFGGERTFLSPLGWFFAQTFHRSASVNWMFGSQFVRAMRGFQTAMFGYPTIWDRNIAPGGEGDAMAPWQMVHYSGYQRWRALLNPAESIFTLKNFRLGTVLSRSLQLIPGINMLSYFATGMDPAQQTANPAYADKNVFGKRLGKSMGEYGWYNVLSQIPGFGSILNQSHTQRSQRASKEVVDSLKQDPEDFPQYKGGGFVHHFTDSANPGVSYVDYTGSARLASRIGSFLVKDVMDRKGEAETEAWRDFYSQDEYVRRQATFSMARRRIAAEVKRLQFQEELTGYGPGQNPMWAPLSTPSLLWSTYKAAKSLGENTANWWTRRGRVAEAARAGGETSAYRFANWVKNMASNQYARMHVDTYSCPFCNRQKAGRGYKCPGCGTYM